MPWTFDSTLIVVAAAVLGFILGAALLRRLNSRTSQIQETELRQDYEWFRTTLASISDGVIASNSDGKVTFLNAVAQALTGWTQEEARGKPLSEVFQIINEENRQTVESPTVRALRDGAAVGLANHTLIAKDGTETCIADRAAPIRDENGGIVGVVLVFRDFGESKRAEEQVRGSIGLAP